MKIVSWSFGSKHLNFVVKAEEPALTTEMIRWGASLGASSIKLTPLQEGFSITLSGISNTMLEFAATKFRELIERY